MISFIGLLHGFFIFTLKTLKINPPLDLFLLLFVGFTTALLKAVAEGAIGSLPTGVVGNVGVVHEYLLTFESLLFVEGDHAVRSKSSIFIVI